MRANRCSRPSRQRGAALFIGLMILIVLALLGVAGMQSTTLQERMAGNFRTQNLAFQNTEARVRQKEAEVKGIIESNRVYPATGDCSGFDFKAFAAANPTTPADRVRPLTRCIPAFVSMEANVSRLKRVVYVFEFASVAHDRVTDPTSTVVIDTVFLP